MRGTLPEVSGQPLNEEKTNCELSDSEFRFVRLVVLAVFPFRH